MPDGYQIGRGGNIHIPDVVPDFLEVPEPFAAQRVERNDAVAEKIVAVVTGAIHVRLR